MVSSAAEKLRPSHCSFHPVIRSPLVSPAADITPAAKCGGLNRRLAQTGRPEWRGRPALAFRSRPYWEESAFYEFTAREIDLLESSTNHLAGMALEAARHIVDHELYAKLGIPRERGPSH